MTFILQCRKCGCTFGSYEEKDKHRCAGKIKYAEVRKNRTLLDFVRA